MPAVFVRLFQNRAGLEMFPVIVRIRDLMEMAANRSLWLIGLRPDHGMEAFAPFADVSVTSEEIDRPGSEPEELGHPGIIVVALRDVAVGAILRRPDAAGGVRKVRIERLAAVTFGGKRLGLRVNPFAIG